MDTTGKHWILMIGMGAALLCAGGCNNGDGRGDTFDSGSSLSLGDDTDGTADDVGETTADTGPGGCVDGAACEGGGVCVSGSCCPTNQACGTVCCADAEVCSFGACVTPGAACENSEDCSVGQYCELGLGGEGQMPPPGCVGGEVLSGACLPQPPECSGGEPPGPNGLPTCVESCDLPPGSDDLSTTLLHEVDGPGYTAPVVIQLDDDDCDGVVSERDIPEIVWNMHTGANYGDPSNGRIKAVSIIEGQVVEKFTYDTVLPLSQVAAGDVDGNPQNGNEVVACNSNFAVVALDAQGGVRWTAGPNTCGTPYPGGGFDLSAPAIADLDKDGVPEVVTERAILNGATGAPKASYSVAVNHTIAVSDVDGDGWLDIVSGGQVFDRNGQLVTAVGNPNLIWPAVGDLDNDGQPEIVGVDFNSRSIAVWRVAGGMAAIVRASLSLDAGGVAACPPGEAGNDKGGGPPTIGDFDGDGTADVALAAGNAYIVFDGAGVMNQNLAAADTVLWANPTNDCSSAQTGSTLFDFDGDGRVEVVYGDQQQLRIYDGLTGSTLAMHPHPTGTINEYPVVADVDADGQADIVAITRETCGDNACGVLRVYGSATGGWVRTRRVWNQHSYHVTNVEEDGSIPMVEAPNWTQPGLNNFRQNKQPGGEFSASDAALTLQVDCFQGYALLATVRNLGQAPLPPGVGVSIFAGTPPGGELLGELETTTTLYPAQSQLLTLDLGAAPDAEAIYATVVSEVPECDMDNNTSEVIDPVCLPVE